MTHEIHGELLKLILVKISVGNETHGARQFEFFAQNYCQNSERVNILGFHFKVTCLQRHVLMRWQTFEQNALVVHWKNKNKNASLLALC